jgi:hypothetical protein
MDGRKLLAAGLEVLVDGLELRFAPTRSSSPLLSISMISLLILFSALAPPRRCAAEQ